MSSPSYGFIGNQKFGKRTASSILVENLSYWMNVSFLEQGAYTNIEKDQENYLGEDLSELKQIDDGSWGEGYIYQSKFKNWVYEDGINYPSSMSKPTICSGIWVGNDFHHKDIASGDMSFSIDYLNGRVMFFTPYGPDYAYGSGVPNGSGSIPIKAEFSYKDIYIISEEDDVDEAVVSQAMSNPYGSGLSYPTESEVPLPVISITERNLDFIPKQLGGFKIGQHAVSCNVYATNKTDRNGLCDVLVQQENKKVPTIDWSTSETPLNEYGDINTSFSGVYEARSAYPWKDTYIQNARCSKDYDKFTEGVVFYEIETHSWI